MQAPLSKILSPSISRPTSQLLLQEKAWTVLLSVGAGQQGYQILQYFNAVAFT
jgi:hypothetical protein